MIFNYAAIVCFLTVWFGLMIGFAVTAYKDIRYEYIDLGLITAGSFLIMLTATFLVLGHGQ
jgi:hypothetical protein